MSQRNKIFVALLASMSLSGCVDYMNHWDTTSYGAGNAPAANQAIHKVEPFNPDSFDTDIEISGKKTGDALKRYREPCDPDVVQCGGASISPGASAAAPPS